MRTQKEIDEKLEKLKSYAKQSSDRLAVIDVLENKLTPMQIEYLYFNESDPWIERCANNAREWLDGEIESDEMLC